MARRLNISNIILTTFVVAAMFYRSSAQTTHVVGDALGWTVPPGGEGAYRTWTATQNFTVGDVLVFNFPTTRHDVAEVTKAEYDSCNAAASTPVITTGPARISLNTSGEHYYICTLSTHCSSGQKLAINVTASGGPAPPRSASPPATPSTTPPPSAATLPQPPPPDSSAPSLAVAALPLTFLAVALAVLQN